MHLICMFKCYNESKKMIRNLELKINFINVLSFQNVQLKKLWQL